MGGPGTMNDEIDSQCLSRLEQAILSERMKGASNLEIALKMFLYEAEVKQRLKMISHKLHAVPQTRGSLSSGDHADSPPRPAA
jgi:DNA-binding NarL/FixJ family response regulator